MKAKNTITIILPLLLVLASQLFATAPKMAPPAINMEWEKTDNPDVQNLKITVELEEEWHINPFETDDPFSIPTTLELEAPGLTFEIPNYPETVKKYVKVLGKELAMYEGRFEITAIATKENPKAKFEYVKANLGYQACSQDVCLRPANVIVELGELKANSDFQNSAQNNPTASKKPVSIPLDSSVSAASSAKGDAPVLEGSVFIMILMLLGWGLMMNLTPCVYPLIAITVSLFGDQGSRSTQGRFLVSLLYVFGISITFSVLGVSAALGGQMFGSSLQSPAAQIVIAVIFVLLALSSFGLYDIRLPASWMGKATQASNTGGYIGGFLAGIFSGVLASPCIGPFILALILYVAEKGSMLTGFWVFAVFSLGMGIPYIILGTASGLTQKLPRSGNWMIDAKKIMGLVLLGLALYYCRGFIDSNYYHIMYGALLIYGAMYVNPFTAFSNIPSWLGALIRMGAFIALLLGTQSFLKGMGVEFSSGSVSHSEATAINWLPYSESLLAEAKNQNKKVLIDFESQIWCAACREMEEKTYSQASVRNSLSEYIALKVDVDKHPDTDELLKKYDVYGIPTAIILGGDGIELDRVIGFMPPGEFVEKL